MNIIDGSHRIAAAETLKHKHELAWVHRPQGVARYTPWGWLAGCKCGWVQEGLAGKQGDARRAYYRHKNEESS